MPFSRRENDNKHNIFLIKGIVYKLFLLHEKILQSGTILFLTLGGMNQRLYIIVTPSA